MNGTQAISNTGVVTVVIEPRLIDIASRTAGRPSSPIVYTIGTNERDASKVEVVQIPHRLCKHLTLGLGHVKWTNLLS